MYSSIGRRLITGDPAVPAFRIQGGLCLSGMVVLHLGTAVPKRIDERIVRASCVRRSGGRRVARRWPRGVECGASGRERFGPWGLRTGTARRARSGKASRSLSAAASPAALPEPSAACAALIAYSTVDCWDIGPVLRRNIAAAGQARSAPIVQVGQYLYELGIPSTGVIA